MPHKSLKGKGARPATALSLKIAGFQQFPEQQMAQTLKIEQWTLDKIKPYVRNARTLSGQAIGKVAKSITEFGWRQPIVVDTDGVIIAGHTRWLAAKHLRLEQAPVHVAKDLTPEQVKAYRLMDNRTHQESDWDMKLLGPELLDLKIAGLDMDLTGFETDEIIDSVFGGKKRSGKKSGGEAMDRLEFKIVIDCLNEEHQTELLERFKGEGFKCRALIS